MVGNAYPIQRFALSRPLVPALSRLWMMLRRGARRPLQRTTRAAMLQDIVEHSFDAIIATDTQGAIDLCNPAAETLFGYRAGELAGCPVDGLFRLPGDAMPGHGRTFRQRLDSDGTGMVPAVDATGIRKDGSTFIAELSMRKVDPQTGPRRFRSNRAARPFCIFVARDVTERRRAEEAYRQAAADASAANHAKTEFLATMSHELRTPLNAVIGFSEIIKREMLGEIGNERYRGYAADIHRSGSHLLEIINDIFDAARIEVGKLDLAESWFAIEDCIQATLKLAAGRPEMPALTMETRIAQDLPQFYADERLVRQILLNLVTNALKFTAPPGRITISATRAADGRLTLAVADTGIGIPAEDIPTALKPFHQVGAPRTGNREGTGLGLSLVKSLTEMHGGELELESAVGKGTLVTCRFPAWRLCSGGPERDAGPPARPGGRMPVPA